MLNGKNYSDVFIIKEERDDCVLKTYVGNVQGTLTIPDGVTRIARHAFSASNRVGINKIVFPRTLKRIPDHNFCFWESLEEITIPEGVTEIAANAFAGTGIQDVLLPSSIDKIGRGAFAYCDALQKITLLHLSDGLLNSLLNSDYSSGATEDKLKFSLYFGFQEDIDLTPFFNKYHNAHDEKIKYSTRNGFIMCGDYVLGYVGNDVDLVVPEVTSGIAFEAFMNNKRVQSITLSEKTKIVAADAFSGCSCLKKVHLNNHLEQIGDNAFAGTAIQSITIPASVIYVGEKAFMGCQSLNAITIELKSYDFSRVDQWDEWWKLGFYQTPNYENHS